jgi:hypothetical protein
LCWIESRDGTVPDRDWVNPVLTPNPH